MTRLKQRIDNMSIRINGNSADTQNTLRSSAENKKRMDKTLEKLSSGRRINRAADDAAGLAIAQKMGEALKGLEQGMRNTYDGLSMAQTADAGLSQISDNLGRMKELAMTAANGTVNEDQRAAIELEYTALKDEVNRVAGSTEFNGTKLLDGSGGNVAISLGTGDGAAINLDLSQAMDAEALGLTVAYAEGVYGGAARSAFDEIDAAMATVGAARSNLGASSNRLVSAERELAITAENTYASQSRILDADFAMETSNLVKQQLMAQSSTAVLAQGKGLSANALNLLK
jgi:flagellin